MSTDSLRTRFSAYRRGLTRPLVALGAIILGIGLSILVMVIQAGRSGDTVAIQRASFVIATGIDAFVSQTAREHAAAWEAGRQAGDEQPATAANALLRAFGHRLVRIGADDEPGGRTVAAPGLDGADLADARAALASLGAGGAGAEGPLRRFDETVLGSAETLVVARLLAYQGQPAVAVRSTRRSDGVALTSLRRFDESFLVSLIRDYAVDEPYFSRTGAVPWPATARALTGDHGEALGYVVWSPRRAGSDILNRLLPILVPGLLMLFALAGWLIIGVAKRNTDFAASEAHARYLSLHDELTGLPNRRAFGQELGTAVARLETDGVPITVALVDVDHFKDVNDTLGHQAGDELVRAVGHRMRDALAGFGVVARLGGDEFAIVAAGLAADETVHALARRVCATFDQPFDLDGQIVHACASAGIFTARAPGLDGNALVRRADIALNRAKSEGRARYLVFTADMDEAVRLRRNLDMELRTAIGANALEVHYQPILAHDGRDIVGAEALVRWCHPQQGMLSPAVFIPIAEETGAIVDLGMWVMRRAFEDSARVPGLLLSINLSPVQFRFAEFVGTVASLVEATGVDPRRIEFEITETVLVRDHERALSALGALRDLGFRIALDDFGTGYSSLSYLRQFRVEKIKIDQSFVSAIESSHEAASIVHALVGLAGALGMTVTAEGVETPEQHRFLQAAGCDLLQGYLFARPVRIGELVRMVGEPASLAIAG